jgi:hypothetical protein
MVFDWDEANRQEIAEHDGSATGSRFAVPSRRQLIVYCRNPRM